VSRANNASAGHGPPKATAQTPSLREGACLLAGDCHQHLPPSRSQPNRLRPAAPPAVGGRPPPCHPRLGGPPRSGPRQAHEGAGRRGDHQIPLRIRTCGVYSSRKTRLQRLVPRPVSQSMALALRPTQTPHPAGAIGEQGHPAAVVGGHAGHPADSNPPGTPQPRRLGPDSLSLTGAEEHQLLQN